jgi:3-methylfumaryl-CoA hydratase
MVLCRPFYCWNLRAKGIAVKKPARYEFRAVRPLFDFDQLYIGGQLRADGGHDLYAINTDGNITMQAAISWR